MNRDTTLLVQSWQKNAWLALVGALLVLSSASWVQAGGGYNIAWWTVDGGGGSSSGPTYSVSGTVGQPEAGPAMSSSSYTFFGGFWSLLATPTSPPPWAGKVYLPLTVKPVPCFNDGEERNPNNSTTEANTNGLLCDDGTYTGRFDDQNDYYALRMGTTGLIDISLAGYTGPDVQILLYYEGEQVGQGYTPDYRISYTGPTGLYYIRVFIPAANNASYSLHVNFP